MEFEPHNRVNQMNTDSANIDSVNAEAFASVDYFTTSKKHLHAELERIDLLIQSHLALLQSHFSNNDNFRGLYISEQDVSNAIHKPIGEPWWLTLNLKIDQDNLVQELHQFQESIEQAITVSVTKGIQLRLHELVKAFQLNPIEKDILLLALATEVDLRYELIFAYLQDDMTKRYLTQDLLFNFLQAVQPDQSRPRQYLTPDSKLIKHKLINVFEDPNRKYASSLNKIVKVPSRVIEHLFSTQTVISFSTMPWQLYLVGTVSKNADYHPDSAQQIDLNCRRLCQQQEQAILAIQGEEGCGKFYAASQISNSRGRGLLKVDFTQIINSNSHSLTDWLKLLIRESKLLNADIFFQKFYLCPPESYQTYREIIYTDLAEAGCVVFIDEQQLWLPQLSHSEVELINLSILQLPFSQRVDYWNHSISDRCDGDCVAEINYLADRFKYSPGQIDKVVNTAVQLAKSEEEQSNFGINHLRHACRLNSSLKLNQLARCVEPKFHWEDIVLEAGKLKQLKAMSTRVRYRCKVFEEWGFEEKLSLGKGVAALFSGPPGTGKTMAAEIIANSLSLELYKVDLSLIVSKYIGETEKNLSKIFAEAETSNAVLFFDEADALFGKRTEVKSSHDRYANVEVAYLLQKMEEFNGITIMATNLQQNMDEAFVRRLAFIIRFPFPENNERLKIWQQIWPKNIQLASDIDLSFMARQFKLAGGSIKNIALAAAFLAAEENTEVEMKHIVRSTQSEFEKQGRTSVAADFGEYGHLLG